MAAPNNAQKYAAVSPRTGRPVAPKPVGNAIGSAVKAINAVDTTAANARKPVGKAKPAAKVSMPAPPAKVSRNTKAGKPPRSPRGKQHS